MSLIIQFPLQNSDEYSTFLSYTKGKKTLHFVTTEEPTYLIIKLFLEIW